MANRRNLTCSRWDCSAVLNLETAVIVAFGDDGEAIGLCPCCSSKEGY